MKEKEAKAIPKNGKQTKTNGERNKEKVQILAIGESRQIMCL